jgi:hypothetical protein
MIEYHLIVESQIGFCAHYSLSKVYAEKSDELDHTRNLVLTDELLSKQCLTLSKMLESWLEYAVAVSSTCYP